MVNIKQKHGCFAISLKSDAKPWSNSDYLPLQYVCVCVGGGGGGGGLSTVVV